MTRSTEDDPRYRAALAAVGARGRFGIRLGLGRTRALLRELGDPHLGLPGVLIGGTNGKGSTQALVAAALRAGGHRVGQTPKPHLVSYRERIVVDGRRIPVDEFSTTVERVLAAADRISRRLGPPTEFEALTAGAFDYFRRAGVEVGVVEVGMGGRLDATNAWQGGVSAITNVALDHMEHLGPTVPAIAREKAAIIKRGDHAAITGAEAPALAVITRRARRVDVRLRRAQPLRVLGMDRAGLSVRTEADDELRIGLLGRHQAANAAVALAILDELADAGIAAVQPDTVRTALSEARWPGRLELLALAGDGVTRRAAPDAPEPGYPDILLDGAHNPHGTAALAAALDELSPSLSAGWPTVLIGVLADKDVPAMLAPLAASAYLRRARVITTTVPDSPRSLSATDLAAAWDAAAAGADRSSRDPSRRQPSSRSRTHAIDDPAAALGQAIDSSLSGGGTLVACGSLYLVGFLRGRLVADVEDA